jgi:hypothetical protein
MLPLLYIQGPAGMRVGNSGAGTLPGSTTLAGTQVSLTKQHYSLGMSRTLES